MGDFIARERVTQCFRDALYDKYRSSNHSKKKRRKEQLQRAKESRQAGQDPGLVKPTKKRKTKRKAAAAASPEAKLEDPSSGASLLAAEIQGGTFNSESLSQNLRVDNLPLPNLQPPSSGKPPIQFPSLSFNDQASNTSSHVPDPTSSLHHLMERQSALSSTFQESLLKQLQPFEPNPQLQQHKEALQLFHQPNQDTLSLTNLHGTVNGEMRNGNNNADSSSYPTNWFTTSSTGSNSNSNLWPTTVNINASVTAPDRRFSISSNLSTSSVNESPVDGQQAMLLFGGVNNTSGVTNQQYNGSSSSAFSTNLQALLCNSQLSSTNSAQQTLMSMASIFQQSNNRPPATGANNNNNNYYSDAPSNFPFDLSLEPTPIAENISRRHLERNQNAFF